MLCERSELYVRGAVGPCLWLQGRGEREERKKRGVRGKREKRRRREGGRKEREVYILCAVPQSEVDSWVKGEDVACARVLVRELPL